MNKLLISILIIASPLQCMEPHETGIIHDVKRDASLFGAIRFTGITDSKGNLYVYKTNDNPTYRGSVTYDDQEHYLSEEIAESLYLKMSHLYVDRVPKKRWFKEITQN